jgi:hypothetical protein
MSKKGFNDFVDPDSESGSRGKNMKKKCIFVGTFFVIFLT